MKRKIKISLICLTLLVAFLLVSCENGEKNTEEGNLEQNEMQTDILSIIDYSKIVITEDEFTDSFIFEDASYANAYEMPKIALETENAKAINEKIAQLYSSFPKQEDEKKGSYVFIYTYEINEDGLLVLMLDFDHWEFGSEPFKKYHFFYYDIKNDTELSFAQYLERVAADKEIIIQNTYNEGFYDLSDDWQSVLEGALYGGYCSGENFIAAYRGLFPMSDSLFAVSTQKAKEIFAKVNTSEGSTLNLREIPSSAETSTVIATIPSGETIRIIRGANEEWAYVQYGEYKGYVSTRFIKIEE